MTKRRIVNAAIAVLLLSTGVLAQERAAFDEQLRRIFDASEYEPKSFGPAEWWEEGRRFTTVENSEIVAYDTSSGKREVLIPSSVLKPPGVEKPLAIDDYTWSKDLRRFGETTREATIGFSTSQPGSCENLAASLRSHR